MERFGVVKVKTGVVRQKMASTQGLIVAPIEEASAEAAETIEGLFAALESPLLSYALRLTGDLGTAEDIVQESFMKLHEQFENVREPRRWLYRTVHNLALNHRRRAAKIVPLHPPETEPAPTAEAIDPGLLPDEAMLRGESIGQVQSSLAALDARSRTLIQLKFHDGLSYKEISKRTGLGIGNVGYLLHHALKTIARALGEHDV